MVTELMPVGKEPAALSEILFFSIPRTDRARQECVNQTEAFQLTWVGFVARRHARDIAKKLFVKSNRTKDKATKALTRLRKFSRVDELSLVYSYQCEMIARCQGRCPELDVSCLLMMPPIYPRTYNSKSRSRRHRKLPRTRQFV